MAVARNGSLLISRRACSVCVGLSKRIVCTYCRLGARRVREPVVDESIHVLSFATDVVHGIDIVPLAS